MSIPRDLRFFLDEQCRQLLERSKAEPVLGMIALIKGSTLSFWIWWIGELSHLLHWMRNAWQSTPRRVLLIGDANWTIIDDLTPGHKKIASTLVEDVEKDSEFFTNLFKNHRRSPVIIRLQSNLGLRCTIDLPIAAKHNLHQLLRYELDRLTPFDVNDVVTTWRVKATDQATQQINVEIVTVPKSTVDKALSIVEQHGLSVERVEFEGIEEYELIDLVNNRSTAPTMLNGRRHLFLWVSLALIAIMLLTTLKQKRTIERVDSEIALIKVDAEVSLDERRRYEQSVKTADFVANSKANHLTMTEILAELTRLIPDQAYLLQLTVQDDTIQLYGIAEKASDLISILERSSMFTAPQFESPVTLDAAAGRERFHVSIQTEQGSK